MIHVSLIPSVERDLILGMAFIKLRLQEIDASHNALPFLFYAIEDFRNKLHNMPITLPQVICCLSHAICKPC